MKKLQVFGVSFFILAFMLTFMLNLVSAIRINEVELNPKDDCNDCTEWIELYSENEVNLTGWKLVDNDNNTMELNRTFAGYHIIYNLKISLNNNNEKIFLYNNETLISETDMFSDNYNDNRTWQYCSGDWVFINFTKGYENLCQTQQQQNQTNQTQQTQEDNTEIYLELDYDKEMRNGEELKVKVKTYNLENENYDIKIFISNETDISLSEIYDEENNEWISGNYYIEKILEGPGNKSESLNLRIKDSYEDFSGDVNIIARIRITGKSEILAEIKDVIEIEEKKSEEDLKASEEQTEQKKETQVKETRNIIKLNEAKNTNIEENLGAKIYKSKTQYIKEYAIYGFALFCVLVIIILIIKNKTL